SLVRVARVGRWVAPLLPVRPAASCAPVAYATLFRSVEHIVPAAADQDVVAAAAVERIVAVAADQGVVAVAALEPIVAATPVQVGLQGLSSEQLRAGYPLCCLHLGLDVVALACLAGVF